jgi:hypothetical protein
MADSFISLGSRDRDLAALIGESIGASIAHSSEHDEKSRNGGKGGACEAIGAH